MSAPRITAIVPDAGGDDAVRIEVDGRPVGRIRARDLSALGLVDGQAWTDERARAVRHAGEVRTVHRTALRLLARRDLPVRTLARRLEARGYDTAVIRATLDELIASGVIDDRALARRQAEQWRDERGLAPAAIALRLERHGIDADVARTVADEVGAETDVRTEALRLAREAATRHAGLPRPAAIRRVAGMLARRGYDEETVETVLYDVGLLGVEGAE